MNPIRSALCCAVLAGALAGAPPALTQEQAESYNQQGITFYRQQRYRESVDAFTNAITLDPESSIYYTNRGRARSQLATVHNANTASLAHNDFSRAIALNPENGEAYLHRGILSFETESWLDTILNDLQHARELLPDDYFEAVVWPAYVGRLALEAPDEHVSGHLFVLEIASTAYAAAEDCVRLFPESSWCWQELGGLAHLFATTTFNISQGDGDSLKIRFVPGLPHDRDALGPQSTQTQMYSRRDWREVAIRAYGISLRLEPSAYVYSRLGELHLVFDENRKAFDAYTQALHLDQFDEQARNGRADIFSYWGMDERAQDERNIPIGVFVPEVFPEF